MIIRQLKKEQYDRLCTALYTYAHTQPLDPSYTATLRHNDREYMLKLQPERDNRIAVLHVLEVMREEEGPCFILITADQALNKYFDLFLQQYPILI